MKKEIKFNKYQKRKAYHWKQASFNIFTGNCFVRERYEQCVSAIKSNLEVTNNTKILDYGCGDGYLTHLISKLTPNAYGTDLSKESIELAKATNNPQTKFTHSKPYETSYSANFFDCVVCTEVIEHVQEPDKLLKEIVRITKPGGTIIITTPIRYTKAPLDRMHVNEYFQEDFRKMISNCISTKADKLTYFESHPFFWSNFISYRYLFKLIANIISLFYNPFSSTNPRWTFFSLQYAVIEKKK